MFALILSVGFSACTRSQGTQSAAPATGSVARPVQPAQPPQSIPTPAPAPAASPQTSAPVQRPAADAKLVASERTQEFTIAERKYRLLLHEQSIDGTTSKTVEWWELRDADDHVVRHESYPVALQNGEFEDTTEIIGNSFVGKDGSAIIIQGRNEVTAPGDGGWVQVFAFKYGRDKYGADASLFGAFGAPIYVTGEFLGAETESYQPSVVFKGAAPQTVSHDVLKFKVWTGNFNITYLVRINWVTGHLQPEWRCPESTSKGPVERCRYPVSAEAHREDQPTFVRLFPDADEGTPKHLVIQPQTKIEFLEAKVPMTWSEDDKSITFTPNGDMWLKVRIDGMEGWIHDEEDFDAVGLPQSG